MKAARAIAVAVLAAAAILTLIPRPAAAAVNPLKTSMVKYDPDFTQVMGGVGDYTWQGCGGPVPGGVLPLSTCLPGQVPIYTSEAAMETDVRDGTVPNGAKTLILDLESWKYTPASEGGSCGQMTPTRVYCSATSFSEMMAYVRRGARFIAAHPGYKLIQTPVSNVPHSEVIALVTQAARYASYGDVVELQAQGLTQHVSDWKLFVAQALASVRAHEDRFVPFLAGLRPQHATAWQMFLDWQWSRWRVQGWWVNASPWNVCAFVNGVSPCSAIIRYFYKAIGVTS